MRYALFNTTGRLNRAPYWGYTMLLVAAIFLPLFALFFYAALSYEGLSQSQIEAALHRDYIWLILAVTAASLWPSYALIAKRLQDHGRSGSLAVAIMAPGLMYNGLTVFAQASGTFAPDSPVIAVFAVINFIVALASFVYLGCMRGTVGPNAYGPDPLERSAPMIADAAHRA